MSGQYPGGYNSPIGRGQFNPQQQQQMMNQMQMGQAGGMIGGAGTGMGGYQPLQQQGNPMQGMQGNVPMNVGLQSPQQQLMQQQQQLQMQQQQQQQQLGSQLGMGMGQVGMGSVGGTPQVGNLMQQQQMTPQMQQNLNMQQMQQGNTQMGMMHQQNQPQQQNQQSSASGMQQQTNLPQQQQQQQQQAPQQQQQQQPQTSNNMLSISQQPQKEINIVTLSRVGQETVQDITSRFQEIFTALKVIQPTSSRDNGTVKKVQEHFRTIRLLFKRMRLIYERCSDGYPQGMEFTHVEGLIPYKDESEHRNLEATQCEEYRKALQENQELIDTVKLKNRQLREIIERTRIIVWEINTMLSMRRS